FKQLLQNIKIGNSFTKKFLYRLFYCLKKIYSKYI
ncbi:putative ORF protein C, partial (apicoplast) [Toxoplasma gondii COUG]